MEYNSNVNKMPKLGRTWTGGRVDRVAELYRHACGLRGKNWTAGQIYKELTEIWRRYHFGSEDLSVTAAAQMADLADRVMAYEPNAVGSDEFWFGPALIDEMTAWFKFQDQRGRLDQINTRLRGYKTRTGRPRRVTPIGYRDVALVALAVAKGMYQQVGWMEGEVSEDYDIPHEFLKPCSTITDGIRIRAAIGFLELIDFYRVQRLETPGQCDKYAPGETSEAAPDSLTRYFADLSPRTNTH